MVFLRKCVSALLSELAVYAEYEMRDFVSGKDTYISTLMVKTSLILHRDS